MPYNRRTGEYYEYDNSNRNYNGGGRRNNNRRPPKYTKNGHPAKSQCRMKPDKTGRPCITGWNVSKERGFITMVSVPCKDFKTKSKNSDKWVASVKFADGKKTFTAFYNTMTKKLTIPDLDMVANPNAQNGGYFGTYVKR